jgi:hypothetical protein
LVEAEPGWLAFFRFASIVASIQSPQLTQRKAGAEDCSAISIRRESVKLGTMRPWHRAQAAGSITPFLMETARWLMTAATP